MSKPKVFKDYDKLEKKVLEQLKLQYPLGFDKDIISFKNHKKKLVSALPFETEEFSYLIRMTREQARDIIQKDKDYDEVGKLKSKVIKALEKKHADK